MPVAHGRVRSQEKQDADTRKASAQARHWEIKTKILEGKYFPFAHEVVGAAVLDKWNFNRSLVMTTLHHSDLNIPDEEEPEEGSKEIYRLAATVNLADCVCKRLGIGQREPDESIDVVNCAGARVLELDEDEVLEAIDFAEESGNFTKLQILAQAGTFAMSQANSSAQNVMSLLQ